MGQIKGIAPDLAADVAELMVALSGVDDTERKAVMQTTRGFMAGWTARAAANT